jgi:hypothetical protein
VWVIVIVFHFTINHPFSSFKRLDGIPGTMTRPQAGKPLICGPIPDTGMALFCSPKCPESLLNHPTLPFNRYQELFPSKVTRTWGWLTMHIYYSYTSSPSYALTAWQYGAWFTFKWAIPVVLHTVIKIGTVSQTQLVNILLLRSFIHIAYLRSNYMFRPFYSRPSSGWSYILFETTIQYTILSLWYLTRSCFHR